MAESSTRFMPKCHSELNACTETHGGVGGGPKVPAKQERVKKQQPTRKSQQYADICLLLPVLREGAAIYHTNRPGQGATCNICVTVREAIKSG